MNLKFIHYNCNTYTATLTIINKKNKIRITIIKELFDSKFCAKVIIKNKKSY